tara:strand:+ start:306 stop:521 length:216 start_codon:yes stop_codon:yes gene_type:complete
MQVGDLVKIKRATNGVPRGTSALIIKVQTAKDLNNEPFPLYMVSMSVKPWRTGPYERQYLEKDLEVISASR